MSLDEIINERSGWLVYRKEGFDVAAIKPLHIEGIRETLAHLYRACVEKLDGDPVRSSLIVRTVWNEGIVPTKSKSLPGIIADDSFLSHYAMGSPITVEEFGKVWKRLKKKEKVSTDLSPIFVEWNRDVFFHDIDATPPGLLSKLSFAWRLRTDEKLLKLIQSDLEEIADVEDNEKRKLLTLGVLSHAASYRELDERVLKIPSFESRGKFIVYTAFQHLLAEGVKTVSLVPITHDAPGIYLGQGTELWPSQPSALGSILANFAFHGAATEAYAHSWRRIHKHLRDLKYSKKQPRPLVAGHSMGGALAIQIGLYSHELIDASYAFNPPMPHERDYHFYHKIAPELQERIKIIANLDDFAFWRIGSKIIGQVTLFLGKTRWRYFPVTLLDCILIFPAFGKFILNVHHAFPAHQYVTGLSEQYIYLQLSEAEIDKENQERVTRFDYLKFFPKLYDPMKTLVTFVRRIFGWKLEVEYLKGELEILSLHEKDLIDTINDENHIEIEKELKELRRQKEQFFQRLELLK